MVVLTQKVVVMRTRQDRLDLIRHLNLWGQELTDVSILEQMIGLEILALPVNNLVSLRDLRFCTNLREIYLRKNQIENVEDVRYLESMKDLRVLSLEENPCVTAPNYRLRILQSLPHLVKLDSHAVTEKEIRNAKLLFQLDNDDNDIPVKSSATSSQLSSVRSSQTQEMTSRSGSVHGVEDGYKRSVSLPSDHGERNGASQTPRSSNLLPQRLSTEAPVFRVQQPRTPRPLHEPDSLNGANIPDQSGASRGSSTSPGVLYAVLTLLGELDVNALKVVKSDVENRLASVNP